MGEVVGAGILAHVPTIMLPPETRLALNAGREISLVPALHQLRREVFETLDYDTVVVLDSHWFTTVEFVVTAQGRRAGLFTAEELPRGMTRIPYDWVGDPELAETMAGLGPRHSTWVTANDDPYLPLYRRFPRLDFLEIGWGSDPAAALAEFPEATIQYIVLPSFVMASSEADVRARIAELLDSARGGLHRFRFSVPDLEHGTPEGNLEAIRRACARER